MHNDFNWLSFIGSNITDSELVKLAEQIGIQFTKSNADNVTQLKDSITFDYYREGLSFYFINDELDSIDFYSNSEKFNKVKADLLPMEIQLSFTGKEFVAKFGEPLEKGGGLNTKLDIWLRWDQLQVEIDEKNWDKAKDAVWNSLTIF